MKRLTSTLAGTVAVALCLAWVQAFAAEPAAPTVPEVPDSFWDESAAAPDNGLPDVRVNRVDLPAGPFRAGEAISGVANVSNPSGRPAEVSLEIGLVALDERGIPRKVYAMGYAGGEFSLAPGQTADVPFSLDVPFGISAKDVSVRVGTRLIGSVYLGWNYSEPFDVAGSGGAAIVEAAFFTLSDGSEVSHTAGPTLYAEAPRDLLPLSVVLRGLGGAVELHPVITEGNRALGTTERRELDTIVRVPAAGAATATIPFSHDGKKPGVYEGEVSWLGADGEERAPRLGFRYIVDGQTATVHAVSSSAGAVSEGDEFRVTVALSGVPVDLAAAERIRNAASQPVMVSVEITDDEGLVAQESRPEVLPALGEISFDFTAPRDASSMVAKITLVGQGGVEIFSRSYPLSVGETAPGSSALDEAKLAFSIAAGVAALLLAAAFLSWRRFRRRAALGMVLLAAAAWGFACYSAASATGGNTQLIYNNVSVGWIENCTGPNIYVNTPAPRSKVSCGSGFTAEGNVQYGYCSNSDNYGSTQLWLQRQGYGALQYGNSESYSMGSGSGHWGAYYDGYFYMSVPGNLISQNGNYGLGISNSAAIGGDGCSWTVSGLSPFTVAGCDMCLNLPDVQATVPPDRFKDTAGETAGICYTVNPPTACVVDNVRTEVGAAATWTATGCDDTCVWDDGSTGATHSVVATAAGDIVVSVKSRKTVTGSDGNVASRDSDPVTCETTVGVVDLCTNNDLMPGTQSQVPAGFVRNAGGACVCPSDTTYDPLDGRCEDEHGLCVTCGGTCGDGVCGASESCSSCPGDCGDCGGGVCGDGACNNGENCSSCPGDCGICVAACPVESASQYCAEIYDRGGNRTGALPGLTAEDLEEAFGYKLPDAVRDLLAAVGVGASTDPIWVAVGRGAGTSDYASAGCGGAMCTYGGNGCLTTIDPQTNLAVARCSPINDIEGDGLPPTALIEIEPSVVGTGGKCSVLWSSHEMRSCRVTGLGLDSALLAGKASTPALQNSATYVLGCTGLDGRAYSDSDTCVVSPDVVEF